MTREESIEEIKSWTHVLMNMGSKCTEKTVEAQSMAIEALKELDRQEKEMENYTNVIDDSPIGGFHGD